MSGIATPPQKVAKSPTPPVSRTAGPRGDLADTTQVPTPMTPLGWDQGAAEASGTRHPSGVILGPDIKVTKGSSRSRSKGRGKRDKKGKGKGKSQKGGAKPFAKFGQQFPGKGARKGGGKPGSKK